MIEYLIGTMRACPTPDSGDILFDCLTMTIPIHSLSEPIPSSLRLYRINARFALNPRLQFSALYQWDSLTDRSGWNLRMSWEYRPLSYFYLVYNKNETQQLTRGARFSRDQFIEKLTYLFEL